MPIFCITRVWRLVWNFTKNYSQLHSLEWSSGQRAGLLLRRSEFASRWIVQFFCKTVVEYNENKQKEAWVAQ